MYKIDLEVVVAKGAAAAEKVPPAATGKVYLMSTLCLPYAYLAFVVCSHYVYLRFTLFVTYGYLILTVCSYYVCFILTL